MKPLRRHPFRAVRGLSWPFFNAKIPNAALLRPQSCLTLAATPASKCGAIPEKLVYGQALELLPE